MTNYSACLKFKLDSDKKLNTLSGISLMNN